MVVKILTGLIGQNIYTGEYVSKLNLNVEGF